MFMFYFTLTVIFTMTLMLVFEVNKPSFVLFAALIVLQLGQVITPAEAFAGFSNHGMLAVAVLFVVAYALQSANSFVFVMNKILGSKKDSWVYLRLMVPVTFLSAFLNNTPIVASLIPVIKNWTKKNGLPASKFLIPLSYASILGGVCTLIGTSTNLVVHGMMLDQGLEGFSFFELGQVGLPVAIIVILYFSTIGHRFLPIRQDIIQSLGEKTREFVCEVTVGAEFPNIGKSIEEAGLRHLKGLFLFQIIRNGKTMASVSPEEKIFQKDRLFFLGLPETLYELLKIPGLKPVKDAAFDLQNLDSDKSRIYEAVIANNSSLNGQNVRDSQFRTKYKGVILAIHREGHRINKKIGDIVLKANDTLLILADQNFYKKWYHSSEFSLISPRVSEYSRSRKKGNMALLLMVLMILSVVFKWTNSMLLAASITAVIMIAANIVSLNDARKAIDFDVLLAISASFGIGKAIANAGIADVVARFFIQTFQGWGVIGIIAGLYILTSFYTEIITNNAAAALIFPIILATAKQMHLNPHPFMVVLAVAASSSYATPIGYQTNLMVYNPGGYRFTDFLKTGLIMNVLVGVITTAAVYFIYF